MIEDDFEQLKRQQPKNKTPHRRADNIDYSEYMVRKTVQGKSLRSFHHPNKGQNHDAKNNLSYFINKQVHHLRNKSTQEQNLKELFQNAEGQQATIYPNIPDVHKSVDDFKKASKQFSLKQDKITLQVLDYIERKKPKDLFYCESYGQLTQQKVKKDRLIEQSTEDRLKTEILGTLNDKQVVKFYNSYQNKKAAYKIRKFKSVTKKRDAEMKEFFPSTSQYIKTEGDSIESLRQAEESDQDGEENNKTEEESKLTPNIIKTEANNHTSKGSAIITDGVLKDLYDSGFTIEKKATQLRKKKLQRKLVKNKSVDFLHANLKDQDKIFDEGFFNDVCGRNKLNTRNLLGVDEWVYEGANKNYKQTQEKQQKKAVFTDDIEAEKKAIEKKQKFIQRFKMRQLRLSGSVYSMETEKNMMHEHATSSKINSVKVSTDYRDVPKVKGAKTNQILARSSLINTSEGPNLRTSLRAKRSTLKSTSDQFSQLNSKDSELLLNTSKGPTDNDSFSPVRFSKFASMNTNPYNDKTEDTILATEPTLASTHYETPSKEISLDVTKLSFQPSASVKKAIPKLKIKIQNKSKFQDHFDQVKHNSQQSKCVIQSFDDFCQNVKGFQTVEKKDSTKMNREIDNIGDKMYKEFQDIKVSKKIVLQSLSKDFAEYKAKKQFKNKLANHIISKVVDKHGFMNAYKNKQNQQKQQQNLEMAIQKSIEVEDQNLPEPVSSSENMR